MAFVQSKNGVTSSATSVAAVFTSNNVAGNAIFAVVGNDAGVTPTIADTRNTWQALAVTIQAGGASVATTIFYAMNIGAGANTVTAFFGATSCAASIAIMEWSAVSLTAALDKTATGQGFGTAATTAATATTTQNDELLILGTCREATATPFTFTAGGSFTEQEDTGGLCPRPIQLAYRVVSATGAYSGAATLVGGSENWSQAIATFKLGPPPSLDQYGFRPRNDDGSETTATWKAAQNTTWTMAADETFRLRMGINATGDFSSKGYKLQYRRVGDASWRDIDTSG